MLGSTLLQVVRPAGRVVVRPSGEDAPPGLSAGRVVVSVDDSTRSQRAVDFAFVQADSRGIGLTAVLSWLGPDLDVGVAPPHEWELLAETLSGRCAQYPGVDVIEKTAPDDPTAALVDESRGSSAAMAVAAAAAWCSARSAKRCFTGPTAPSPWSPADRRGHGRRGAGRPRTVRSDGADGALGRRLGHPRDLRVVPDPRDPGRTRGLSPVWLPAGVPAHRHDAGTAWRRWPRRWGPARHGFTPQGKVAVNLLSRSRIRSRIWAARP
jgi:hypothetical protein